MVKHAQKVASLAVISVLSLCANGAHAASMNCADYAGLCVANNNALFIVDPNSGVQEFVVDGVKHIFLQDFMWDNTGLKGQGMDVEGMDSTYNSSAYSVTQSGNTLSLLYTKASHPTIQLSFTLLGGALGSNTATIQEYFTITNTATSSMNVSLFAYTDVDLGATHLDDRGELIGSAPYDTNRQYDTNYQLIAQTDIPPDYYKVGVADTVVNLFNPGGGNVILDNTVAAGPGDLQMAAQWVRTLAAASGSSTADTFGYSHSMTVSCLTCEPVSQVPLPASLPLALGGLAMLGMVRRKKRQS